MPKAGWRTTEFWVTLLVLAICGAAVLVEVHRGKLDAAGAVALVSAAVVAAGYSSSRGKAKGGEA